MIRFFLAVLLCISTFIPSAFAASKSIIYEFYAPWCGVCRSLAPKIEALENEGYHIVRVNIDENTTLTDRYQVDGVPTVILVKNGKVIETLSGNVSMKELEALAAKSK